MRKRGFTLIELIVVMAIIAILILLGVPKYKEYVKDAHYTKIMAETKALENASMSYYMKNNEWPRLTDTAYTKEQLETYAQEIYDKTGKKVDLDEGGSYYDISYSKLKKYIKEPKGSERYILQNPVGCIYYLDKLTEVGKTVVVPKGAPQAVITMTDGVLYDNTIVSFSSEYSTGNGNIVKTEWQIDDGEIVESITPSTYLVGEHTVKLRVTDSIGMVSSWVSITFKVDANPEPPVIFKGLSPAAFDKDSTTLSYAKGDVTWDGNLDNKVISLDIKGFDASSGTDYPTIFKIYDANNTVMNFIDLTDYKEINIISTVPRIKRDILIPEGAVKFVISSGVTSAYVYDIYVKDDLESPLSVYDVSHTSNHKSITLNWKQDSLDDRFAIYKNGKLLGITSNKTYTNINLYADTTHTYSIKAINSNSSSSSTSVEYTAKTQAIETVFRGFDSYAFDKDSATSSFKTGTITWDGNIDNKVLSLDFSGFDAYSGTDYPATFTIYDTNNKVLSFIDLTNYKGVSSVSTLPRSKFDILIPEGAVKFTITAGVSNVYIYDIHLKDDLESPLSVYDVSHTSNHKSITLTWKQDSLDDRFAIYKNDKLLGITANKTYTDVNLYADTFHTYSIKAINSNSSSSSTSVEYTAKTQAIETVFKGFDSFAFDKDDTTFSYKTGTITWDGNLDNKVVFLDIKGFSTTYAAVLKIYNANNQIMNFTNLTDNKVVNNISTIPRASKEILVPEGAVKFVISSGVSNVYVYDIYIVE